MEMSECMLILEKMKFWPSEFESLYSGYTIDNCYFPFEMLKDVIW